MNQYRHHLRLALAAVIWSIGVVFTPFLAMLVDPSGPFHVFYWVVTPFVWIVYGSYYVVFRAIGVVEDLVGVDISRFLNDIKFLRYGRLPFLWVAYIWFVQYLVLLGLYHSVRGGRSLFRSRFSSSADA